VLYTANHCYLITEYCEGGNLEKYTKNNENVEWGTIAFQIAQGCQYLSGLNIIHRDLKPANIFLKEGVWKIGDFGFSKRIPQPSSLIIEGYKVGTPLFMPLETL
jgi:serine/threonine protein kinase